MNRFALSLAAALALAIAAPLAAMTAIAPTAAEAKTKRGARDPEMVIRDIYKQYDKQAGPAEAEQQNFSESLYKLWIDVQAATSGVDDVGVDFDVFLDAQDLDAVTNLVTKFTAEGKDKGTVDARFTAFGKQKAIAYAMVKTPQGWKIDNIFWKAKGGDLRSLLAHLKSGGGQMSN